MLFNPNMPAEMQMNPGEIPQEGLETQPMNEELPADEVPVEDTNNYTE